MATATLTGRTATYAKGHNKTDSRIQLEGLRNALGEQSLEQLHGMIRTLPGLVKHDDNLRQDVLRTLKQLQAEIETPWDTIQRIFLLNPWNSIAIDIAVNMGVFRALVNSSVPLSAHEVAAQCDAEVLFTQRLLRCLNGFGAVKQRDSQNEPLYAPSSVTYTFTTPMGEASARFITEFFAPAWFKFPAKLKAEGHKSQTSGTDTIFNELYNAPGKHIWEILGSTPHVADGGYFMSHFNSAHKAWTDVYPVNERLIEGADQSSDAVFMIDIGGYTGSQATALHEQYPQAPGKFLVLDLAATLPPADCFAPGVGPLPHDFFAPYPAEACGARCYYMRYISHDWSQEALIQILTNIKNAMKPGYSKLIINDWIVPEKDPHPFMCSQDLVMMHLGGGEERTETRHREAINTAGLRVTGIFRPGDRISESVIECEVLEEGGCDCACTRREKKENKTD
ncbi:Putative O-methyltransferase domain, S-adenosyl-L-methionine-dependent methyltransferase [Septoria linicola]|uniref:O-methyltransferase domain, S-adenosyl-L-methionine-dependent methyltransferase n=1 Tax=Septoria linicola TaxID=215465 RepID=A0A9Q9EI57_9PEZI|nr:Putative O-methyltransferase domain, S-adenosyl-L-methionine-dependent methyltransferase [Septoria linicola]